jgi:dipeptidyl aminopeptidase/acylaminoacyl peptidase
MRHVPISALLAAAALCGAVSATARPFTVSDLLHEESVGRAAIDPTGHWLAVERRDPYDTLGRYDYYLQTSTALSRLEALDLHDPKGLTPLIPGAAGRGVVIAAFSPTGRRLAVYRLQDARWTLGVVDLATRRVRWLPVTPDKPTFGRALEWRSERALLVINRPDGVPPFTVREGQIDETRLPRLWAQSRSGAGAHSLFASGRYSGQRPRPAPRQLLEVDAVSGRRRVVATGAFEDFELSPDGARAAVFEAGPDIQSRPDGPVQGAAGLSTHALRLSILDLRTGARRAPCADCDALPHLLSWSPSGTALLAFLRHDGDLWPNGRLMRIDAATGRGEPAAPEVRPVVALRPDIVQAGWMGEDPVVYATPAAGGRADWYRLAPHGPVNLTATLHTPPRTLVAVDAEGVSAVADGALWRLGRTGEASRIAAGPVSAVPYPSNTVAGRLQVALPPGSWLRLAGGLRWLEGATLRDPLGLSGGDGRVIAASAPAGAALLDRRAPSGVERLALLTAGRGEQALATLNAGLAEVPAPRLAPVAHGGPDGRRLTSWLFLPPGRPARPPPLVVQPYAGATWPAPTYDKAGEVGFEISVRTLVGHGYAVLVPSLPNPKGRGDPMAGLAQRIEAIVDTAAADPALAGAFDPQRLALWGFSYGGYTVQAALTQSQRFKAAVSIAGLSDLVQKWESIPVVFRVTPDEGAQSNQSMGDTESGQDRMYAPPWADPQRYIRNSPIFFADRIDTPLLLVHGDLDAITMTQSESMFSALYRQDKAALFVTYWGEGHVLTSPGNVRDLYARAFAFLDENLKAPSAAAPPPANPGPGSASAGARLRR